MSNFKDLSGNRFGKLVAVERGEYRRTGYLWRCVCDCGAATEVQGTNLRNGHTASCGGCPETKFAKLQRFLGKVKFSDVGCWIWQGSRVPNVRTGKPGYGLFRNDGELEYAHRFSCEHLRGEPLGELFALHHCDSPGCVRPDHLFRGTQIDNVRDMVSKGRGRNQHV